MLILEILSYSFETTDIFELAPEWWTSGADEDLLSVLTEGPTRAPLTSTVTTYFDTSLFTLSV